jgi:hypothetical protein
MVSDAYSYYYFFVCLPVLCLFLQPFKNVKNILSSQTVQTQALSWIGPTGLACQSLYGIIERESHV